MNPDAFLEYMVVRGLFPALGIATLGVFWMSGVFRAGYLARGPSRRLRIDRRLLPWLFVAALLAPVSGIIGHFADLPATAPGPDPDSPDQVTLWGLWSQAAMLIAPAIFLAWITLPRRVVRLGLARPGIGRQLGIGLALVLPVGLVAMGANGAAFNLGLAIGQPADMVLHSTLKQLIDDPSLQTVAVIGVYAVLIAPVLEEIAYRGVLQTLLVDLLGRRMRWAVVVGVSAGFAVMHLPLVSWHAVAGLFVVGVGFGAVYERTGSLWSAIVLHAGFNAANIGLALAAAG